MSRHLRHSKCLCSNPTDIDTAFKEGSLKSSDVKWRNHKKKEKKSMPCTLAQSPYVSRYTSSTSMAQSVSGETNRSPRETSESRAPSSNRPHSWEDGDTAPPVRVRQTSQLNLVEIVCRLNFLAKYTNANANMHF
ncbi:uncharacterized protein LOC128549821 [Mercenaria mercenaria]|uniref:uncharacterized protein LOC128549821 n=1 Tax=Mercenaria mercenaria TaxID=6596 RepID=UPI00234F6615|nr:uncharacterized protein LOC128549821 [Mercenaria mercenaria]